MKISTKLLSFLLAIVMVMTLLPNFALAAPVNITYGTGAGGEISGVASAEPISTVTVTIDADNGYRLKTLTAVKTGTTTVVDVNVSADKASATFVMPAEPVTLTPTFEALYDLNAEAVVNGSGTFTVTPVGGIAQTNATEAGAGDSVVFNIAPDAGYVLDTLAATKATIPTVVAVTVTPNKASASFTMPAEAVTVTPAFKKVHYALSVDSYSNVMAEFTVSAGGVGLPTVGSTAQLGDYVSFTLTTKIGYKNISNVSVACGVGTLTVTEDGGTYSFTMGSDTAVVSADTVSTTRTITLAGTGKDNVTVAPVSALDGTKVTIVVTPKAGYSIATLNAVDAETNAVTFIANMPSVGQYSTGEITIPETDVTITVNTTAENYSVADAASIANGNLQYSTDKTTWTENLTNAHVGDTIYVKTLPATNYRLSAAPKYKMESSSLLNNTTADSTQGVYSFTMPAKNVTVTATFAVSYALTDITSATQHGTLTFLDVNGKIITRAAAGEKVYIEAAAESTYKLTGLSGITITSFKGKHYFTMPTKAVSVAGTFSVYRAIEVAVSNGDMTDLIVTNIATATAATYVNAPDFTMGTTARYYAAYQEYVYIMLEGDYTNSEAAVSINNGTVTYTTVSQDGDETLIRFRMPNKAVSVEVSFSELTAITATDVERTSNSTATLTVSCVQKGYLYYLVQDSDTAPTARTIKNEGTAKTISSIIADYTLSLKNLDTGRLYLYLLLTDSSGNALSGIEKVTLPAYGTALKYGTKSAQIDYTVTGSVISIDEGDFASGILSAAAKQTTVSFELYGVGNADTLVLDSDVLDYFVASTAKTTALSIVLPTGTLKFNSTALDDLADEASKAIITFSIEEVAYTSLTTAQKNVLESKTWPIYEVKISSGTISTLAGSVTLTVSYALPTGTSASGIQPYYLGTAAVLTAIADNTYAASAETVQFPITQFNGALYVIALELPWTNPFTDVKIGDWYYDYVKLVNQRKLFSGVTTYTFAPTDNVTRGMFVTVLARLEDLVSGTSYSAYNNVSSKFTDVVSRQYYSGAVRWAAATGIVEGVTTTTFCPDDEITREQMTALLVRYANYKGIALPAKGIVSNFYDASQISTYAKDSVSICQKAGIISGANGYFRPLDNAQRAEVAKIFAVFIENYV